MSLAVCTLYGVAALINSLHKNGFKGNIYAGYKGGLPKWALAAKENPSFPWPGVKSIDTLEGIQIHFLPIESSFHLTNYKPDFMLKLWDGPAKDAVAIAYFDPDIVVKCKWEFYSDWMSYGVALVHEINSNDMPVSHPLRKEWEKVINLTNRRTTHQLSSYLSGGFCGVHIRYIEFLHTWKEIFETGIKHFKLTHDQWNHDYDRTYIFYRQDQDAFNIAAMCCESPLSEIGPEGMDFIHGGWTMSHAAGSPKPWKNHYLLSALNGKPPSLADKGYWSNVNLLIKSYHPIKVSLKQISILISSFISRFYSRK